MTPSSISSFRGLNNVRDPLRLGMDWFVQADNVHITDTGALERREGFSLALACHPAGRAYGTEDQRRAYVATGLLLCAFDGVALVPISDLTTRAPIRWAEINGQVFWDNGADSGIIGADHNVHAWRWPVPPPPTVTAISGSLAAGQYRVHVAARMADGRITGTGEAVAIDLPAGSGVLVSGSPAGSLIYISPAHGTEFLFAGTSTGQAFTWTGPVDALGVELSTALLQPLPDGAGPIAAWRSRIFVGRAIPDADASVIWPSEPLAFHLFDLATGFITVPGEVRMLAPHPAALVIGTDRAIHAYDGRTLTTLASYGVTPGQHHDVQDDGTHLFMSLRGICAAVPFTNLTERQYSLPPGRSASGTVVRRDGQVRYIVSMQQGGQPFNSSTERTSP